MSTDDIADIRNVRIVDAELATAGQPTEAQLAAIAADGYHTVINLALHDDPRYSLNDEAGLVQSLGMNYVRNFRVAGAVWHSSARNGAPCC